MDRNRSLQLAAAEDAYVASEMERLALICRRNRMDVGEYGDALAAAWSRSIEALETLTALRTADAAEKLRAAVLKLELV